VLHESANADEIVRQANLKLEDHQRIRSFSIWTGERLPRTEGTKKLKHGDIQAWVETGRSAPSKVTSGGTVIDLLRRYAPDRTITPDTTLDQLGLSSLDRVELMLDLEEQLDTSVDESLFTGANPVSALDELIAQPSKPEFPAWNRLWFARIIRRVALTGLFFPMVRAIARARITGAEHLISLRGPVIFAPNHQSHLDTPLIMSTLPARYRYRVAPAMWKEYFDGHFCPSRHTRYERVRDSTLYRLIALFFNAFPIPQTEAGARQSLRYLGELVSDNWSVLFFPEGERTEAGEIKPFLQGIGLIAARLRVPIVPIRLRGFEKILHRNEWWPHPGCVEIAFGPPLHLKGQEHATLAKQVEEAVRAL
jgi:long-chain acyl-CoA synthetase